MSTTGWDRFLSNYSGSMNDRQKAYLLDNIVGVVTSNSINDLWFQYLGEQGYDGTLTDRMFDWAGDVSGSTSVSISDRLGALPSPP